MASIWIVRTKAVACQSSVLSAPWLLLLLPQKGMGDLSLPGSHGDFVSSPMSPQIKPPASPSQIWPCCGLHGLGGCEFRSGQLDRPNFGPVPKVGRLWSSYGFLELAKAKEQEPKHQDRLARDLGACAKVWQQNAGFTKRLMCLKRNQNQKSHFEKPPDAGLTFRRTA